MRCTASLFSMSALVLLSVAAAAAGAESSLSSAGEVLYNGIRLLPEWPPRLAALTDEPMPVPYLADRPAVVSTDVGRQLFVDDFLVEQTSLTRTFHRPEPFPGNPVLTVDKPWERAGQGPMAAPFSDGVWYDPCDRLFKLWYMAGLFEGTGYATSRDGVRWEKPALDVIEKGTNLVTRGWRDSQTIWLDHAEKDSARRYKMFTSTRAEGGKGFQLVLRCSADGVHWSDPAARSSPVGDRTTVFYNPFRKVWVYSIRSTTRGRDRTYRECADAIAGAIWKDDEKHLWIGADRLDPHNPNEEFKAIVPQLYNLDAVAYESVMLGLLAIWQGPNNNDCAKRGIQKRNEILLGFSRDGFHWYRPDRRPFIGVTEKTGMWNWGNVQSAGGGCLVVGDRLYFYFSGRALADEFWDARGSTGLAVLRRDGFASMDAGTEAGVLTTRPVRFSGRNLFVNADASRGELAVEILDEAGQVIEPFSRANCRPVKTDKTLQEVTWQGAADLSAVGGRAVRFRFHLRSGSLYAFWVSPDSSGASRGYVAAGGPGFFGSTDTLGEAAYRAALAVVGR